MIFIVTETKTNNDTVDQGLSFEHFFFGLKRPQNGQTRPKTVKIRIILRYFALFLARKKCEEGAGGGGLPKTDPIDWGSFSVNTGS